MTEFNAELESRLRDLDLNQATDDFLRDQEKLCEFARHCYEDLVDIVYDHTDKSVRENGMWVIRFLHMDNHQTVLNDIRLADSDPQIRSLAETILYGSLVDESLRDAAAHPGGLKAYLSERTLREGNKDSNP